MEWENDLDFILGYLRQCKKENIQPKYEYDILLKLCEEVKKLKDEMNKFKE